MEPGRIIFKFCALPVPCSTCTLVLHHVCARRCLICRQRDFDSHSSGTTGVVVLMRGSRIWTAHAGDSRCALGRRFSDGDIEAKNLTLDHKV